MIISDTRRQVFCHIPKNGGSSLRAHFLTSWEDAREYQGRKPVDRLDGALRDLTHITPQETAAWFDDELLPQGYGVTAVIRAPMPRFSSALLQYIRSFAAENKHFVTADTVRDIMASCSVQDLCAQADTDLRYIYFRPQSAFLAGVAEENRDLVLIEDLSTRFPDLPVENPGGRLPGWMGFAKHPAVKKLAGGLGRRVKARMGSALIRKDPEVNAAIKDVMAEHHDMLTEFYAADQALYDGQKQLRDTAA